MNQTQRNYLIDKVKEQTKSAINELEARIPKKPDLRSHCLNALLNGQLRIKSADEIFDIFKQRASYNAEGAFSNSYYSKYNSDEVCLKFAEIFILPESYTVQYKEWEDTTQKIRAEIANLRVQTEGLCTRIQLASNKTLENLIAEVDNMGDLSFMDLTLRSLMTRQDNNLIGSRTDD